MLKRLGYAARLKSVFDAELFEQQGTRFVKSVVLCRESHPRIDAIGGPGTRVNDGVVGQCDGMEYRRLNAVLPALGKMDPRWLRIGEHRDLRKRVLVSFRLKDTIRVIESECYAPDAEPKDSVDQDTGSRRFPNLELILDVVLRAPNMIACNQEKQWVTCPKLR